MRAEGPYSGDEIGPYIFMHPVRRTVCFSSDTPSGFWIDQEADTYYFIHFKPFFFLYTRSPRRSWLASQIQKQGSTYIPYYLFGSKGTLYSYLTNAQPACPAISSRG